MGGVTVKEGKQQLWARAQLLYAHRSNSGEELIGQGTLYGSTAYSPNRTLRPHAGVQVMAALRSRTGMAF
jgi:hypothetical protein